ncbi:hypothetical protein EOL96_02815 [Candidatus Saccharibacteria bacterium]|nr:hypothetical protein [Candidatus Saccharibacteria bacterium]
MLHYYLLQLATAVVTPDEIGIPKPVEAGLVNNVMFTVYFWSGTVAVIVLVIAGYFYTVSNGNQQQVVRAKNAILGAVVGLIVILLAFSITAIVAGGV